ncbi:MAG: hypothetical protein AVDCRST_MAG11-2308 [uncultured Gemmatimonadaceae bacterium]|uniref:Uncharacterized protein n=1 Tax=uncultured Gemmatimonadaceae bacterium TaxID=246130 RepID=A0A6J4LBR6_9BACT|nr:MAG: hypothetical protein AVDCRST_MAG11-2308 [uncultured Gemmatimonadaceae bacterium]
MRRRSCPPNPRCPHVTHSTGTQQHGPARARHRPPRRRR